MLVSLEKTPYNITMYCHVAHLERQDCNLCAGPDFKDYAFSGLGVLVFISEMRGLQGHALPAHSEKMQRWKHQYTFFPVWLRFQRSEEEIKHFKVSNFSFGKNSLGIGAFPLSSVWPFTIHQGSSSAVTFCSAHLQTANLWTWLNSTGAQHWKLVWAAPHSLMEWQLPGSGVAASVHLHGIVCLLCRRSWHSPAHAETCEHTHKVQSLHKGWICGTESSSFPRESLVCTAQAGYFPLRDTRGRTDEKLS